MNQMERLERSAIALATLVRKLEGVVGAVATRDGQGDRLDAELDAQRERLARHCNELEASAISKRAFSMPYSEQRYIAATVREVARLIADRADFEVIRQLCAHPAPINDDTWDEKVTSGRGKTLEQFVCDFEATAQRSHPGTDPLIKETRHKFSTKLTLCLKVALGRARVQPARPSSAARSAACMACDRPFLPTSLDGTEQNPGGDARAARADGPSPRARRRRRRRHGRAFLGAAMARPSSLATVSSASSTPADSSSQEGRGRRRERASARGAAGARRGEFGRSPARRRLGRPRPAIVARTRARERRRRGRPAPARGRASAARREAAPFAKSTPSCRARATRPAAPAARQEGGVALRVGIGRALHELGAPATTRRGSSPGGGLEIR